MRLRYFTGLPALLASVSTAAVAQDVAATGQVSATAAAAESSSAAPAGAPYAADETSGVGDIIVTAQKRSESINKVPMSITAVTGEGLAQRGVTDTADLTKVVAGFTFAQSAFTAPVYTLRGVGLYESGLASSPAVAVYVDEVPLPFPVMTLAAALDLERVEVLKGPQGTLFGQSATGGAINYIAAKPTDSLQAGANATYERFGKIDVDGFVSGPLSSTVNARLAVRAIGGGSWQRSLTRPDDRLGDSRQIMGRLLLDWQASDRLSFSLNVNGNRNHSDVQAPQLVAIQPAVPSNADPRLSDPTQVRLSGDNARDADWSADWPMRRKDNFYQIALRSDYELTDEVTLTSLTSYARQKVDAFFELDGTPLALNDDHIFGSIKYFDQELRLAGTTDVIKWVAGVNYDHAKVSDEIYYYFPNVSFNQPNPAIPAFDSSESYARQKINTYAAFGNLDFNITDSVTLHAGARYTKSVRNGVNCNFDPNPNGNLAALFGSQPGECFSFNPDFTQDLAGSRRRLSEDNLSWRFGLDYALPGGALLYANASRGYKAGVISNIAASTTFQFDPVKQERLDAYEVGFKAPLFDRRIQFNGAAFYYDYKDKQLRGRFFDDIFSLLERLINIPKSRIWGLEGQVIARPITGLDLSVAATYIKSKVTGSFTSFNQAGEFFDFKGSRLPYTPTFQLVADGQYQWALNSDMNAFVGAGATHHSADNTTFRNATFTGAPYRLKAYTLLDLRAGLSAPDDSWRVSIFGRNVTNSFYYTTLYESTDVRFRYAGRPVTYGMTVSIRTR